MIVGNYLPLQWLERNKERNSVYFYNDYFSELWDFMHICKSQSIVLDHLIKDLLTQSKYK